MKKHITVRGVSGHEAKHSHLIRNYIYENCRKVEKLLMHVGTPVNFDVIVDVVKPHPDHHVTMHIRAPHFNVVVKKEGTKLYKVIDETLKVTVQKLVTHKEKGVSKRFINLNYRYESFANEPDAPYLNEF